VATVAEAVKFDDAKLRPLTVINMPTVVGKLMELVLLTTGASNVNKRLAVPATPPTVTSHAEFRAAGAVHPQTTDVPLLHTVLVHRTGVIATLAETS
jgi:hypothetical protein